MPRGSNDPVPALKAHIQHVILITGYIGFPHSGTARVDQKIRFGKIDPGIRHLLHITRRITIGGFQIRPYHIDKDRIVFLFIRLILLDRIDDRVACILNLISFHQRSVRRHFFLVILDKTGLFFLSGLLPGLRDAFRCRRRNSLLRLCSRFRSCCGIHSCSILHSGPFTAPGDKRRA